jgi:hypothetical protein
MIIVFMSAVRQFHTRKKCLDEEEGSYQIRHAEYASRVEPAMEQLINQAQELKDQSSTQNSLNQYSYQQHMKQVTNLLDTVTQFSNAQTSTEHWCCQQHGVILTFAI